MLNLPSIGDIVLDPSEKFADLDGKDKFDLLLADGSEVLESEHPMYWATLPSEEGDALYEYCDMVFTNGLSGENLNCDKTTKYIQSILTSQIVQAPSSEFTAFRLENKTNAVPYWNLITLAPQSFYPDSTDVCIEFAVFLESGFPSRAGQLLGQDGNRSGFRRWSFELNGNVLTLYSTNRSVQLVATIPENEWVHVAFQRTESTNATLYVNGYAVASTQALASMVPSSNGSWAVGNYDLSTVAPEGVLFSSLRVTLANRYQSNFTIDVTEGYKGEQVLAYRPIMDSGSDECPYRVVADKHTPSIGDVRPTNLEKYKEDGVAMFDYLLCDGSEVFESEHPEYYATLDGTIKNGESWVVGETSTATSFTSTETAFYVLSQTDQRFYMYDTDKVYSSSFASRSSQVRDMTIMDSVIYSVHPYPNGLFSQNLLGNSIATKDLNPVANAISNYNGFLWVLSDGGNVISEITTNGAYTGKTINIPEASSANGLTIKQGQAYIASRNTGAVWVYDMETGAYLSTFSLGSEGATVTCKLGVDIANDRLCLVNGTNTLVFSDYSKNRPTIDSGSDSFPYRVVADLTEGDL